MRIADALRKLRQQLAAVSETASLDGQVLLAQICGAPRAWVLAHPEASLSPEQERALAAAAARLEGGEPLPYVLGEWEFFGLKFRVGPEVLIPRPETELLVEAALAWLAANSGRVWAADVGTGSGAIAVSLVVHQPALQVLASDRSLPALRLARDNAARHAVSRRVHWVQSDLLPAVSRPFDLICANLPYISTEKLAELRVARWEPLQSLDGGPDGLALIARLLRQAPPGVAPGGLLLLELEASQGAAARRLAQAAFPHAAVTVLPDLAGHDRLLKVQLPLENHYR